MRKRTTNLDSMLTREFGGPFDQLRSIFIHIPKAAGTSIARAVYGHQVPHTPITEYYRRDYERAASYYKFTFVRDPFSRFVSAYRYLRRGGMNAHDRAFATQHIEGRSLSEFAFHLSRQTSLLESLHFRPQHSFITHPSDPRKPLVNFIGRVETLTEDMHIVTERLGLHVAVEHLNRTPAPAQMPTDISQDAKEMVYQLYEHDYELFAYPR